MGKKRIDILLIERNLAASVREATALLMAGKVTVNEQLVTTAGTLVPAEAKIAVAASMPYVSRGGYKLAAGLAAFNANPREAICADIGASTGGFSDVLLQYGAKKVYAIDVGYGDLAWKLRQDPRVIAMERTNARKVKALPEKVSLVVIDTSFISLKPIILAALKWVGSEADVIALVKPQFEADKSLVEKGGVVRDRRTHEAVLNDLLFWATRQKLTVAGLIPSPLIGPAGNKEFLVHLTIGKPKRREDVSALVKKCLTMLDG